MVDSLVHANTPVYKFSNDELCLALEVYLNNKGIIFPAGKRTYYAGHDHLYFFIDIPNPNERLPQEANPDLTASELAADTYYDSEKDI